jgi:thiol-disulfide isomerase/thioredoxin
MKRSHVVILLAATALAGLFAYLAHDALLPYAGPVGFRSKVSFAVQLPGGGTRDVKKPAGKVFVVHFWATWCPPCAEELPGLLAYAREIQKDPSIELLAVSVDDDFKTVSSWLKEHGAADLPIALDPGRRVATRMGTEKFPETYILSANGDLVAHVKGPVDWSSKEIRAQIDELRHGTGASTAGAKPATS